MNIKYLFILLLLLGNSMIQAQSKISFIAAAEEAYNEKNYHGALVYFDEALKFDNQDADILYKTAEAARKYNAYGFAASKYKYLLDTLKNSEYPDATYRLGEMYHKLGQYDKALMYYNLYLSEYSNTDITTTADARKNVDAVKKAQTFINNVDKSATILRMGNDVNSDDADFAASDRKGNMYFSSLKYESKAKALRYKQIAKSLVKAQGGTSSELISGSLNERDQSVAHIAFNANQSKAYYSVCDYVNGWSQSCKIYRSDLDESGNFTNEFVLPNAINDGISSSTQPNIGIDISGKEILYFVSNRSGGQGGRDIYSSVIDGNNFGVPVNLTAVNTKEDEISPFYHLDTKTLYWSTEGRAGFGGFDIFRISDNSSVPELMPAPYNTSMNDMFYYMDETGTKGYLTSNRSGAAYQYDSYEACCMDIYSIDVKPEIRLDVLTLLQTDNSDLNGTRICLLDGDTGFEIECYDNPQDINKRSFKLIANKNYKLIATKDGYTSAKETFRTSPSDKVITKHLLLSPSIIKLEVFTFENPSRAPLPGTTVTLTDLTDGSVQKIVVTNDKGHDFVFDVKLGRKYKLEATKDGFTYASELISTVNITGTIRKDLYLQRATLQELLPISLYFDNDFPNPRSNQPTTTSRFVSLANDYILRKGDYIKNFTAPLAGEAKQIATAQIESFFTDDVQNGRDKLIAFMVQLEQRLSKGEKIELEVRGFASPRSKSDYNKILSERRVNSIKNELSSYNGGFIKKYIDNGALRLKDVTFGDKTSKPNVIGDLKDERNSIYNINAAKERRVEILKVNYN